MRRATLTALAVVAALALALAGCGGGGNGEGGDDGDGAATNGAAVSGEQVFAQAGCGGCHVLEEAGSTGRTGPALDGASLSVDAVEQQVREGGGGMPSFEDQLSDEEIQAVSEFVADASQS